uniref:Peptidase C1A papain C-terminal domain-containing protein n=1 Tax=Acrobeloides nanus TaxID=290746 RepID=A0A914DP48_9BILA
MKLFNWLFVFSTIGYTSGIPGAYIPDLLNKAPLTQPKNIKVLGEHGKSQARRKRQATSIPTSFDWRDQSVVTSIKDQGSCGCCWAFASSAIVESQVGIAYGPSQLVDLAEQELVDCENISFGCNGGYTDKALQYVETNGLAHLADYPFISGNYPNAGSNETCKPVTTPKQFIDDWYYVGTWTWGGLPNETLAAETLVEIGPLSHAFWVPYSLFNYNGGIYHPTTAECQDAVGAGHETAVVGFGEEGGVPYWIIKNSWGPDWGENGYFRLYRGDGTCNEYGRPMLAAVIRKPTTSAPATTQAPTEAPTQAPTEAKTQAPTEAPTQAPTKAPTPAPTPAPVSVTPRTPSLCESKCPLSTITFTQGNGSLLTPLHTTSWQWQPSKECEVEIWCYNLDNPNAKQSLTFNYQTVYVGGGPKIIMSCQINNGGYFYDNYGHNITEVECVNGSSFTAKSQPVTPPAQNIPTNTNVNCQSCTADSIYFQEDEGEWSNPYYSIYNAQTNDYTNGCLTMRVTCPYNSSPYYSYYDSNQGQRVYVGNPKNIQLVFNDNYPGPVVQDGPAYTDLICRNGAWFWNHGTVMSNVQHVRCVYSNATTSG